MTVTYSVTFEFDTRAPLTHKGTVLGSSGATCVARAARIAQKALRPVNWSSMVVVERAGDDGHTDEVFKLKLWDKMKALELAAKYFKLLTDIIRIDDEDKKIAELDEGREYVAAAKRARDARLSKQPKA